MFYDKLIFSHSITIQSLTLHVRDVLDTRGEMPALHGFLDSVRICTETKSLALHLQGRMRNDSVLRAQAVVNYMYDLEHLSFAGFSCEPYAGLVRAPGLNRHILDLLPPTLVSLHIVGRVSNAMAVYNENAL